MSIEVTITGRGPDSSVPDNASAVDADVTVGGVTFGVTLLESAYDGELGTWGTTAHWCSHPDVLDEMDRLDIEAIVDAVRAESARDARRASEQAER